jgi:hypothetical protein
LQEHLLRLGAVLETPRAVAATAANAWRENRKRSRQ